MSESYCEYILADVMSWIRAQHDLTDSSLLFMYNIAPIHKSIGSINFLETHKLKPTFWPALSPDLNPTEAVRKLNRNSV